VGEWKNLSALGSKNQILFLNRYVIAYQIGFCSQAILGIQRVSNFLMKLWLKKLTIPFKAWLGILKFNRCVRKSERTFLLKHQ